MSDIVSPEKGNLYKVIDALERIDDRIERSQKSTEDRLVELEGRVAAGDKSVTDDLVKAREDRDFWHNKTDSLESTIRSLSERCDALDKALPRGEKVFRSSADGAVSRDDTLRAFGKCFTASRRAAQGRTPEGFSRAQTEGTETAGGILVPDEVYPGVVRIIEEKSIIRQIAQVIPMGRDKMDVPTRSSGPAVYWPSEGAAPTESSVTFASGTTLDSKTLAAYDAVSRELDEDSLVALEPFLAEVFASAIAKEENRVAFVGDGDPYTGVSVASGVASVVTASGTPAASDLTFDNLVAAKFAVDSNVIANGCWIFNAATFQNVVSLKDSNNRPIFATNYGAGAALADGSPAVGAPGILLGSPVYFSATLPSNPATASALVALYGAFKPGFCFGDRKQITIETSNDALFTSRKRAIMVHERVALLVALSSCFSKIVTAAS